MERVINGYQIFVYPKKVEYDIYDELLWKANI